MAAIFAKRLLGRQTRKCISALIGTQLGNEAQPTLSKGVCAMLRVIYRSPQNRSKSEDLCAGRTSTRKLRSRRQRRHRIRLGSEPVERRNRRGKIHSD